MTHPATTFRALTQHECVALLRRTDIGRVAFVADGRPEIVPLNYVHEAGRLYGRTSARAKLATLAEGAWVAFEADEIRGSYDWWSVVVHGTFHRLDADGSLEGDDGRDAAAGASCGVRGCAGPFRLVEGRWCVGRSRHAYRRAHCRAG